VAVTRAAGRRRLRLLLAAIGVLVLGVGALVVLHSPLLAARHVQVVGAVHTPVAEVRAVAGLAGAPPLVDVDGGAAAARLARLPWVASASVVRRWPDSVVVHVVERVPAAVVAHGTSVAVVDVAGRVLEVVPSAPAGLVAVVSPAPAGGPGSMLGPGAAPALAVVAGLETQLPGRARTVVVAADGTVTLDLGGGVTVVLGTEAQLPAKLAALASLLAGAPPTGPETIDVRVPGEPTVGPPPAAPPAAGGSGAATSATHGAAAPSGAGGQTPA
jgi:cell division protein FtsQ